jgi:hypothetical protein
MYRGWPRTSALVILVALTGAGCGTSSTPSDSTQAENTTPNATAASEPPSAPATDAATTQPEAQSSRALLTVLSTEVSATVDYELGHAGTSDNAWTAIPYTENEERGYSYLRVKYALSAPVDAVQPIVLPEIEAMDPKGQKAEKTYTTSPFGAVDDWTSKKMRPGMSVRRTVTFKVITANLEGTNLGTLELTWLDDRTQESMPLTAGLTEVEFPAPTADTSSVIGVPQQFGSFEIAIDKVALEEWSGAADGEQTKKGRKERRATVVVTGTVRNTSSEPLPMSCCGESPVVIGFALAGQTRDGTGLADSPAGSGNAGRLAVPGVAYEALWLADLNLGNGGTYSRELLLWLDLSRTSPTERGTQDGQWVSLGVHTV